MRLHVRRVIRSVPSSRNERAAGTEQACGVWTVCKDAYHTAETSAPPALCGCAPMCGIYTCARVALRAGRGRGAPVCARARARGGAKPHSRTSAQRRGFQTAHLAAHHPVHAAQTWRQGGTDSAVTFQPAIYRDNAALATRMAPLQEGPVPGERGAPSRCAFSRAACSCARVAPHTGGWGRAHAFKPGGAKKRRCRTRSALYG